MQWQRRGGEKWILVGDSNTSYFHKCANGRRRKMQISMLELDNQEVVDPQVADMHLVLELWPSDQQIQQADNEFLIRPFSSEEIDNIIKEMKSNTTPGPDGFSVEFFKSFWPQIKGDIKEMLDNLHAGMLELWRLNYGVIILLPMSSQLPTSNSSGQSVF